MQINLELGKRFNPEAWPWEKPEETFTELLKPTGYSWEEAAREEAPEAFRWRNYKYKTGKMRNDGQPGFQTATGRIELWWSRSTTRPSSTRCRTSRSPIRAPAPRRSCSSSTRSVLTTGARNWSYFHSEHRQIERLRRMHPDPIVQVHPDKLAELGMEDGEWVWIENQNGRAKIRIESTPILTDPRIVACDHAWWRPEGDPEKFFDVFEYNINNLMVYSPGKSGFGSNYKTSICRLYKLEDGE